jgi:hypothetical protein
MMIIENLLISKFFTTISTNSTVVATVDSLFNSPYFFTLEGVKAGLAVPVLFDLLFIQVVHNRLDVKSFEHVFI